MNQKLETLLINSLQSALEWDTDDIEKEFSKHIHNNFPEISSEKAAKILDNFLKLNALEREQIEFDFSKFLKSQFKDLNIY